MSHIPVLLKEVAENLNLKPEFTFIDATVGGGGYVKEVLRLNPKAKILGIDLDQTTLTKLQAELVADGPSGLSQNIVLVSGNFADLKSLALANGFDSADAILLDLGFSSAQLDDPSRGLSFQNDGPLDMRLNQNQELTAGQIISSYSEDKLAQVMFDFGEERFSKRIAKLIVQTRNEAPITTTKALAEIVTKAMPGNVRHKANDTLRRVFQALRIEVNRELENLKAVLPQALDILKPGGRILVISFHSLEDRIVKQFFVEQASGCVCPPEFPTCICNKSSNLKILTRKPITAGEEEIKINPRSKPAKLRVAEKVAIANKQ